MELYVILTAFLFQKGSAESKDPEEEDPVDADPRESRHRAPDLPVHEVLDGRNAHPTDGVRRALGREPKGFSDSAS
jgi:hypothetical protein